MNPGKPTGQVTYGLPASALGVREWDVRVVWLEAKQRWWWNAWRSVTATELHGFADSREDAKRAMYAAIEAAGPGPREQRVAYTPEQGRAEPR